jgi:FkbH-like protein
MQVANVKNVNDIVAGLIAGMPRPASAVAVLRTVDWRQVPGDAVAEMLEGLRSAGTPPPRWLCEALLKAGHALGDARPDGLAPVFRALEAVRDSDGSGDDAPAELDVLLASLPLDDDALDIESLSALLRLLCDNGLEREAAALAVRAWRHGVSGPPALRAAIAREIESYPAVSLKLLSFSTADGLEADLKQAFAALGRKADVETRMFSDVWSDLIEPDPACEARFLFLDAESLFSLAGPDDDHEAAQHIAAQIETLISAVEQAASTSGRPLFVSTLATPTTPLAGYLDGRHTGGLRRIVDSVNAELHRVAAQYPQLTVIDTDIALADIAPTARSDPKLWFYGRIALSAAASRALSDAFANAWRGVTRGRAKVLALDLDNTLWGGVVGEDGTANVACGGDFPGNAYEAFQRECLRLKRQGMLLVALSKNDPEALDTFANRADMPLATEDFVAARVNWRPKPDNIRAIAEDLGLGLDSFIFIDDSPHERDLMRRACPQVIVPEMPRDPARRPGWLRAMPLTWPVQLSAEDARRSEFYSAEQKARELASASSSFEAFLESLCQQITPLPGDDHTIGRIAQMHAKTNQFNLTTQRFDEAALRAMMADRDRYEVLCARVTDKFGDHGIVVAGVLRFERAAAHIDSLLMSCRVIGRRVEYAFMDELVARAAAHGATEIYGYYRPTERNALVADFYPSAGFETVESDATGSVWVRLAAARTESRPSYEGVVSP